MRRRLFELSNFPPIRVRLFHSRRKCARFLADVGMETELLPSQAQTVTGDTDGGRTCVVLLDDVGDSPQDIALLVHESVHVAQAYWDDIGEESPSSEFMAYTVQQVAQYLMEEHCDWLARKARKARKAD